MAAEVVDAADMDVPPPRCPWSSTCRTSGHRRSVVRRVRTRRGARQVGIPRPPSPRGRKPKEDGGESGRIVDAVERLTERVDRLDRGLGRKIADNSPDEVTISNARGREKGNVGVG